VDYHWGMIDLEKIKADVDKTLDPKWTARYGDAAWKAALMQVGEPHLNPADRRAFSPSTQHDTMTPRSRR